MEQLLKYTTQDFIYIEKGFYYCTVDNTVYYKICGKLEYLPIVKLDYKPQIKTINKEFNHRIVFLKVKTLKLLGGKIKRGEF